MNLRSSLVATTILALLSVPAVALDKIALSGDWDPTGRTIEITSELLGRNGILTLMEGAEQTQQPIGLKEFRVREVTVLEASNGVVTKFQVKIQKDDTRTTIGEGADAKVSEVICPLVGKTIIAEHRDGTWVYRMEGAELPDDPVSKETLHEIGAFQNRAALPSEPVALGESWDFDPSYLNAIIDRDLKVSEGKGTMTLTGIEILDGEKCAVLELEATSKGMAIAPATGKMAGAKLTLKGKLVVSLETFVEKSFRYEGTIASGVEKGGTEDTMAAVVLPVTGTIQQKLLE